MFFLATIPSSYAASYYNFINIILVLYLNIGIHMHSALIA